MKCVSRACIAMVFTVGCGRIWGFSCDLDMGVHTSGIGGRTGYMYEGCR